MIPTLEPVGRDAGAPARLAIELRERSKPAGGPPMIAIASGRASAPARATDCGVPPEAIQTGKGCCKRTRIDALAVYRRTMPAFPRDLGLGADAKQEIELLREQFVIVVEVVAEQRKGFDERAAPGHDLGAPAGDKV